MLFAFKEVFMTQEFLCEVCLPFVQTVAGNMNPSLRVETGVPGADANLVYKVWLGSSRLCDFVIFSGDISPSSIQELKDLFASRFRVYLASAASI